MTRMSKVAALLVAWCGLAGTTTGQAASNARHGPMDYRAQPGDRHGGDHGGDRGGDRDGQHQVRAISLDDAVAIVRARYPGKVIRAETHGSDDHPIHQIRILSPEGRVYARRVERSHRTDPVVRLLVVEDEAPLRDALAAELRDAGFVVNAAADGEEGLHYGIDYPIDLAIIDLGLPRLPGMQVIERLRAAGKAYPILVLTARDRWQDKVAGLQAGADDYVTKPFHTEEILARVQALLRRAAGSPDPVLRGGPIELDTRTQRVRVNGAEIELTSYEYRVLEHLMLNAGKVVTKSELTDRLYEEDLERDSNVIEVFIGRLRRKLDPDNDLRPIETLRGRGYRFALARQ